MSVSTKIRKRRHQTQKLIILTSAPQLGTIQTFFSFPDGGAELDLSLSLGGRLDGISDDLLV